MKFILKTLLAISAALMHVSCWCMKNDTTVYGSPQTKTYIVPPNQQIHPEELPKDMKYLSQAWITIIQSSYASGTDPKKNSLFMHAHIITYPNLLDELKKAAEKGVDMRLLISPKTFQYIKKNKNIFEVLSQYIRVYTGCGAEDDEIDSNHAKILLYSINNKQGYSIGSSNMSGYGLFHNNEINQITDNDSENYALLLQSLDEMWRKSQSYEKYLSNQENSFSPLKRGMHDLKNTPEKKRTIVTSLDKNLGKILYGRLDPKKFEKGDSVWLSSFTYNYEALNDALCALREKEVHVNVYVDKDPLAHKDGSRQLKKLFGCGANVYVYKGKDNKHYIHHAKFEVIKRQGNTHGAPKTITIVSTQNIQDPEKNKAFDVLSIDLHKNIFNTTVALAQSYEKNPDFKLLTKDDFVEESPTEEKKPSVSRRLNFDQFSLSKKTKK